MEAAKATNVDEEVRPSPGTLSLIYDEVSNTLDDQHDYIESLNGRAQQLFGFALVILTIVAAVVPASPTLGTKIIFMCALPFFVLAALDSGRAWEFRSWRADPNPDKLWEHFRNEDEAHVRHQVILNRRECLRENQAKISDKLRLVKRARIWLYGGFLYIIALLIYQVITG